MQKPDCWNKVKNLANELCIDNYIELLSTTKEEANIKKREAKNNQEIDNSAKMQEFVIKLEFNYWNNILINDANIIIRYHFLKLNMVSCHLCLLVKLIFQRQNKLKYYITYINELKKKI